MEETKTCPKCGKEVLAVAKKCKHCNYWFENKDSVAPGYRRCPICNEIIPDDVTICPCCDEPIEQVVSETIPIEVAVLTKEQQKPVYEGVQNIESDTSEVKPTDKKSRSKTIAIVIGTTIILALSGVILYTLNKQSHDYHAPTVPTVRTDEDMAIEVAEKWNMYHQRMDPDGIASLFAGEVNYYHETYTPKSISESKKFINSKL